MSATYASIPPQHPNWTKISAPSADFIDVAPDNANIVRDKPDDLERRPPPAADLRGVLDAAPDAPAHSQSKLPVPLRPDVRRELFLHYVSLTDTTLMTAHNRDGHPSASPMQLPTAQPKEDVMLDPVVFCAACTRLIFKPSIDLFANAKHHQCARHCGPSLSPNAVAANAFSLNWKAEWRPYANPPWSLIGRMLHKVTNERVTIMSVIPDWPHAPWYAQ